MSQISRRDCLSAAVATAAVVHASQVLATPGDRKPTGTPPPEPYDLSDLPTYAPERQVSGTLRFVGTPFRGAVEGWQHAFAKIHPGMRFANSLPSSDVAMPGLIMDMCDIAPSGREAGLNEVLGFSEKFLHNPVSVVVASGAWNTPGGASWSPVILVHRDNPLSELSMAQLDGIFGEARSGGFTLNSVEWLPSHARGPERNIRTWGQLGLTGAWADKPIQTMGYAPTGMRAFFELRVLNGGAKWNPNYCEYVDTGTKMVPPGEANGSIDMLKELARNPYAIAWSGNGHAAQVPGLKTIALGKDDNGPYFAPNARNMQRRDYPLTRDVFMHINRKPGQPLDPRIREFLRFVLSREAQEQMAAANNQLPLNREMALRGRAQLD